MKKNKFLISLVIISLLSLNLITPIAYSDETSTTSSNIKTEGTSPTNSPLDSEALSSEHSSASETAEASEQTSESTHNPTTSSTESKIINYETEKEKSLAVGYTEDQFQQIMNMPEFPNMTLTPRASITMNSDQSKVVNEAKKYLGVPYVWGGTTPSGFDCSGLVQWVYSHAVGINLPRVTTGQETQGKEISLSTLLPGDLLFYGSRGNTYHVGIYIGNGQMLHAPKPGDVVKITNISYFYPSFARRILSDKPSYPSQDIDKNVTITKNWSIWTDLTLQNKAIANASVGTVYKTKKIYTHTNGGKYYELYKQGTLIGYINADAVRDFKWIAHNESVSIKKANFNFWGDFDFSAKKGLASVGTVYEVNGSYTTGNGAVYYSIYQKDGKWMGYLNADATAPLAVTKLNQKVTITKDWTIWNDLNFSKKVVPKASIGTVYDASALYTQPVTGVKYYELYKQGNLIGYINADAITK